MKLDEKIVSYFESCNSPIDKEGYLYKKGEIKTSYQKRWCVLKGNLLFYKERQADRDLTGVIVLEGCTVQLCESEEQFAFSLVWSEPGLRTYKFSAEDQTSQESWIKALTSANHNYLALLVMDLENKYKDALVEFSSQPARPFTMPDFSATLPARSSYPTSDIMAGSNQMLQAPAFSSKSVSKKSPKLWTKKNANAEPGVEPVGAAWNPAAPALGDWSGVSFSTKEEFTTLHEDYGKEVKELIADWSKRRRGNIEAENLIDFG